MPCAGSYRYALPLFLSAFAFLVQPCLSARFNVTIDDTKGDPTTGAQIVYIPQGAWTKSGNCPSCIVQLDPARLEASTWHDTTSNYIGHTDGLSSASVAFTGTAVYVQVVLPGNQHTGLGGADADYYFSINGTRVGSFTRKAPNIEGARQDGYLYNVTALALPSIAWGSHRLTIDVGQPGGPEVLLLLDSIIYTHDDALPTPLESSDHARNHGESSLEGHGSSNAKLIASIAIPIFVLTVVCSLAIVLLLRRRKQADRQSKMQLIPLPYREVHGSTQHLTSSSRTSFPSNPSPETAGLLGHSSSQSFSTLHPREWDASQWQQHSQSLNAASRETLYQFSAPYNLVPHNRASNALSSLPSAVPRSVVSTALSDSPDPPPYSKIRS